MSGLRVKLFTLSLVGPLPVLRPLPVTPLFACRVELGFSSFDSASEMSLACTLPSLMESQARTCSQVPAPLRGKMQSPAFWFLIQHGPLKMREQLQIGQDTVPWLGWGSGAGRGDSTVTIPHSFPGPALSGGADLRGARKSPLSFESIIHCPSQPGCLEISYYPFKRVG